MNKGRLLPYLLTGTLLAVSLQAPASAETLSQKQKNLQNQAKQIQNQLKNVQNNKETLTDEIASLDQQLSQAQADLNVITNKLNETKTKLAAAEDELIIATDAKNKHFNTFGKRIKFIHENGTIGYLDIILQAESFGDMLTRMQYVNDIMRYDNELLDKLQQTEDTIDAKTKEIEEEKNNIQTLADQQKEKTDSLNSLLTQKQSKLSEYNKDEERLKKEAAENKAASDEVARLINQSSSSSGGSSFTYSGGKLGWPVPGRTYISSGYSGRERPIGSGYEFHTGLDIPAPYGYNILAAESGTVITAGWVRGYGNTVIINHGGGLSTLYGHNSSLVVSKGQTVTRGQVIAKCGSTGNSTGNHCHFEVRVNGQDVNPWPYVQ